MKGPDAGQHGDTIAFVGHHSCDDSSSLVTDERMNADGCQP